MSLLCALKRCLLPGYASAVQNLSARVNGNAILQLQWNLPLDTGRKNRISSDIISYTIIRALDVSFSSNVVSSSLLNQGQVSPFVFSDNDPALIVGNLYFYKVLSRNLACGSSSYCGDSAVINITVVGKILPPS